MIFNAEVDDELIQKPKSNHFYLKICISKLTVKTFCTMARKSKVKNPKYSTFGQKLTIFWCLETFNRSNRWRNSCLGCWWGLPTITQCWTMRKNRLPCQLLLTALEERDIHPEDEPSLPVDTEAVGPLHRNDDYLSLLATQTRCGAYYTNFIANVKWELGDCTDFTLRKVVLGAL